MRHVSLQYCRQIPSVSEVADDIVYQLDTLGVEKACVVAHSYGTLVAAVLARRYPQRIASLCLIDAVCFGVFMPKLVSQFVYRKVWRS